MSEATRRMRLPPALSAVAGSANFASAVATTSIGAVLLGVLIRSIIGWPGYLGILISLVALEAVVLVFRRDRIEWRGLPPVSLLVFVGWCAATLLWSQYQWATAGGVAYQITVAFLALAVALSRDLIQILRAFGDVLRVVLGLSLAVEVLSGLLLDTPFPFLSVQGNLASGGPIQGVLGSRNMLGLVALLGVITFAVEYATRSVPRVVAAAALAAAALCVFFSRSPVTAGVLIVGGLATLALLGLRRIPPERRRYVEVALLLTTLTVGLVAYLGRNRIIATLNAGTEFEVRYDLWRSILNFVDLHQLEGFGWLGYWRRTLPPYYAIGFPANSGHDSALNAFVDVWLQAGLVGLVAFIVFLGVALVRSWLLAANRRNVTHLWTALVLVALVTTSAAESAVLVEYGWFVAVVCSVKAAQELSWRHRLP